MNERLRSEPTTDQDRVERIRATVGNSRATTVARRTARERELRASICIKLGGAAGDALNVALTDSAVLAALEISEVLSSFLRGRSSGRDMQRAQLARGELRRSLAAMGLAAGGGEPGDEDRAEGPPPGSTPSERREWAKRYVASVFADGAGR